MESLFLVTDCELKNSVSSGHFAFRYTYLEAELLEEEMLKNGCDVVYLYEYTDNTGFDLFRTSRVPELEDDWM